MLGQAGALPFLFVGSGFSKRYLNLPDWEGLLKHIANLVSPEPYYYLEKHQIISEEINKEENYNEFMTRLCDEISLDLSKIWFRDSKFNDSRSEAGEAIEEPGFYPLKFEVAKFIKSHGLIEESLNSEFELLKSITQASIGGIITTNYDSLLEETFGFTTYDSQDALLFNPSYEISEVYKIHGSVDRPNSIIINSSDYRMMEDKNKYLAAKLLTIFIENPLIFIGYSIQDEDILKILNDIAVCLSREQLDELSKRMIFIDYRPGTQGYVMGTWSVPFSKGGSISVTKIELDSFVPLYNTIANNKSSHILVRILRQIKSLVYDLVISESPSEKIKVYPMDNIIESDSIEVVAGVGVLQMAEVGSEIISEKGYSSVSAQDIFRDIVFDDGNFDNYRLVSESIPSIARSVSYSLPIYKYTAELDDSIIPEVVKENLINKKSASDFISGQSKRHGTVFTSTSEIINSSIENIKKLRELSALGGRNSIEEFQEFLKLILSNDEDPLNNKTRGFNTELKRVIKILDYLKYSKN